MCPCSLASVSGFEVPPVIRLTDTQCLYGCFCRLHQDPSGGFVLLEAVIQKMPPVLNATVKADNPASLPKFVDLVNALVSERL